VFPAAQQWCPTAPAATGAAPLTYCCSSTSLLFLLAAAAAAVAVFPAAGVPLHLQLAQPAPASLVLAAGVAKDVPAGTRRSTQHNEAPLLSNAASQFCGDGVSTLYQVYKVL
jgi:hypothetical protein